jgi:hypothetical protein
LVAVGEGVVEEDLGAHVEPAGESAGSDGGRRCRAMVRSSDTAAHEVKGGRWLQADLWPGGSRLRPSLLQEEVAPNADTRWTREQWWQSDGEGAAARWRGGESERRLGLDDGLTEESEGSGWRTWPWRPVGSAVRELVGGDRATTAWPRGCMCAGRDTRPWAIVGLWQAGPFNLNFSLNFKISTNFEIHNEGLPDVQKYSYFS